MTCYADWVQCVFNQAYDGSLQQQPGSKKTDLGDVLDLSTMTSAYVHHLKFSNDQETLYYRPIQ